jgi:hypothetical protein
MTIEASRRGWDDDPASSQTTESILAERGIAYSFETDLRLDAVRMSEGEDAWSPRHLANEDVVMTYAVQMRQGAVFPAIVVTDSFEVIDGNCRLAAKLRCGATSIAAYVCANVSASEIRSLSIELNHLNGQRMTNDEVRNFVVGCIRGGVAVEPTTCARITGIKASTIARWATIEHCRARATAQGLSTEAVSDAALVAVASARLDRVFADLLIAAASGAGTASRLHAIAMEANAADSEADAVAVVSNAIRTGVLATAADASRHSGHRSARYIGGLLQFSVDDLLDVAPDRQRETHADLCLVRDLVNAAVLAAEAAWLLDGSARPQTQDVLQVV